MSIRSLSAGLLAGAMVISLVPAATVAQGQPAPAAKAAPARVSTYKAPRAADGRADISGVWSNATLTRLERAATYGERQTMTREELVKIEGDTDARNARLRAPTDQKTIQTWTQVATQPDTADECQSGSRGAACGYNAGWTDPGDRVMRVAGQPRTSFVTFPANGRIPPSLRQPAAAGGRGGGRGPAAAVAGDSEGGEGDTRPQRPGQNDNPEGRSLGERCIMSFGSSSGPIMQPQLYNNTYRFYQTKNHVAIWVEMVHDVRVVRLNATHRTDGVRPYMGDSIGRWEGDTLVVETVNYHPSQRVGNAAAGPKLKVTERFTRVAPTRLLYQFRIEDPDTWAQTWGGEYEFDGIPGDVYEYACHEGNYGLQNILAGARAEEAEALARTASAPRAGTR